MNDPLFTIVLPTTGEKGEVIKYAIKSVLRQSIEEFELFVVGDGMGQSTRGVVSEFVEKDPRVRLYSFPKQKYRGTINRHQLLTTEARGDFVCYICDRDLWTADHLEAVLDTLREADFAYSLSLKINRENFEFGPPLMDLRQGGHRQFFLDRIRRSHEFLPLSGVGHTMSIYRRLPEGWRHSGKMPTDYYMWLKFLQVPECCIGTTLRPTLIWFPKSEWGTESENKVAVLDEWYRRTHSPAWMAERWKIAFQKMYVRAASFRVRAALAEHELGWEEQ